MMDKKMIVSFIRLILRIVATIIAGFFIIMFVAHLFTPETTVTAFTFRDIVMFFGMILMLSGMVIFWFRELLAGILVVGGYMIFSITNLISSERIFTGWTIFTFFIVGLLFLLVYFMDKNPKKGENE